MSTHIQISIVTNGVEVSSFMIENKKIATRLILGLRFAGNIVSTTTIIKPSPTQQNHIIANTIESIQHDLPVDESTMDYLS